MVRTNKIKRITAIIVEKLIEKGIPVKHLILYGSYANGRQQQHSDIDIAVISPIFEGKGILKRQELLGEVLYSTGEPVEALGYTPKEYRNPPSFSFLSEIISTGRLIYSG